MHGAPHTINEQGTMNYLLGLRHFHNTAMSKAGATAEERMSQLGHSRIETNQLYTHHDVEGRRKVLEKVFGT